MKTAAETDREPTSRFTTISGRPIERLYTAADVADIQYARDVNDPGVFPYTRGIHRHRLSRQALDDAASSRASARRRTRTSATRRCCAPAAPA
jgi:methylmalonyl-CoA mutase N-terminal domain/subunit